MTAPADRVLVDAGARTRIVEGRDVSLVVRAGAGAGKTTTMVDRLVESVVAGEVQLEELVAISFTERSARDLAHRVRLRLGARRPGLDVDRAFLGTIHGFCRSILATYPIEAGLPPAFTTTDDISSDIEADRRTRRVVRRLYDAALTDAALAEALAVLVGTSFDPHGALNALVRILDLQWHHLERWAPRPARLDGYAAAVAALHAAVADALAVAPDNDKLTAIVAEWSGALAQPPGDLAAQRARLVSLRKFGNAGTKAWLARPGGRSAGEVRAELAAARDDAVAALDAAVVERLLAALVSTVVDEANARLAAGQVSFDDLLVLAARLVSEVLPVREALQRRHRRLFVDEYQDTDVVQHELITALASVGGAIEPGRLFAVGDAKQSIYSFRAAEVRLFAELGGRPDTEAVELVTNFRSRPGVIDWVNALAEPWFASDAGQVHFSRLSAARSGPAAGTDPGPEVVVLGLDTPPGTRPADARRAEAEDLAATVTAARAQGWLVTDGDDGAYRPVRFGDMAVLLRTRTGLASIEAVFTSAGIPYRLDGGSLVYDTREVRELLRVLRAVDDPTDELAVVSALRTTVLGVRDADLVAHRRAGGRWDVHSTSSATSPGPVGEALAQLRRLVADKVFRTPAELLAGLAETHLSWAAALVEGGQAARETWRRVRYVIDEARAFSDATGGTLREYLAWVDRQVADVARREVSPDETDEDAVRILTIHAAKGLEYPMVLVAGLGADAPSGEPVEVRRDGSELLVSLGGLTPTGVRKAREADVKVRDAEAARLVYVACTRAMDHLVVSCHGARTTDGQPRGVLLRKLEPHARAAGGAEHRPPGTAPARLRVVPLAPPSPDPGEVLDGEAELEQRRAAAEARSVWSATAVAARLAGAGRADRAVDEDHADDLGDPPGPAGNAGIPGDDDDLPRFAPPDTVDDEPVDPGLAKDPRSLEGPPEARGRYGTAVGRAVHQVLQEVDLQGDGSDIEALATAAALAEDVAPAHRAAVVRLARSILASEVLAAMRRSPLVRRELYVGAPVAGQIVWGYLDAVFVDDDGRLVVVDFKTDLAPDGPDALLDRYRGQLASYLLALAAATGRPVGDAWLVVARDDAGPASCVALTGPAREAALAEVRSVLIAGA